MDSVEIKLGIGGVNVPVHPIFGDDVKMKVSKPENQIFYRTQIDGKIIFSGSDFDIIEQCSDDVEFTLSVYRGSALFGSGTFLRPDCVLNYDNKTCEVKLTVTDRYEQIMANLDNKYNLIKLKPKIESLTLVKRPVLQFYAMGDKKITNVFGNMSFEADTINEAESKDNQAILNLGFTNLIHRVILTVPEWGSLPNSDTYGDYSGAYNGSLASMVLVNKYGYRWKYESSSQGGLLFKLYDSSDNLVTVSGISYYFFQTTGTFLNEFVGDITLNAQYSGGQTHTTGKIRNRNIYGRLLIDKSTAPAGWVDAPKAISSLGDDIYDNTNSNYGYVCGITSFSGKNGVFASSEKTTTPTEYYDGNGEYYVPRRTVYNHGAVFPIGQSMWFDLSYWYISSPYDAKQLDEDFGVQYELKDAFPLYSAIQVLLAEVAPNVTYEPTLAIHEFFRENYIDSQLRRMPSGFIPSPRTRNARLYISPITNVKKTRYEQAAQRGDITLKQILDMLRNLYGCYWWIDDNNQFRIEHITYFKNNNSYLIGTPIADLDITKMKDMPNGLPWAYGVDEVEFDRKSCPSRYEFEWGDDCTEQFNGFAIEIEDKIADPDTKEKVSITNFTADIDYCIINPQGVSDDIYALIEASWILGRTSVPEVYIGDGYFDPRYLIQNGYCSFLFAEQNYLNYDLGGWKAKVNGFYLDVKGVRQYRTQNVNFPTPLAKIAGVGAIRTNMGVGLVKEQEINADTLFAKTKITLEGERDFVSRLTFFTQGTGPHGWAQQMVTNPTNNYIILRFLGETGQETPFENKIYSTQIPPNTTHSLGYWATFIPLSARLTGTLLFDEVVKSTFGGMTYTLTNFQSGADLVFNGNGQTKADWIYVCLTCKYRTRINLTASSESVDRGYVARKPIVDSGSVVNNALAYVGGEDADQYIAEAGEVVYIGYTKDDSIALHHDTITIEIEVPED